MSEGRIKFIKSNVNDKYYYIDGLFKMDLLEATIQDFFERFDAVLDKRESIFSQSTPEEQAAIVKFVLSSLLKISNILLFSQAVSNPQSNSNKKTLVEIKKRIQRLYRIIDSLPEDSEIRIWFLYLLFGYKESFRQFRKSVNGDSKKFIENFMDEVFFKDISEFESTVSRTI
ncbi:protein of unknown function [Nitrosotalea devaniterrae]|uniref:Uncharacterized protein n=1 Tax=Nitrosotalea devaniterrae TaxID=1078905 RepID=A0A128A2P4_9ARCH|nr:protein of unknown function [Candidatus Nitrosotalea devanaterra]